MRVAGGEASDGIGVGTEVGEEQACDAELAERLVAGGSAKVVAGLRELCCCIGEPADLLEGFSLLRRLRERVRGCDTEPESIIGSSGAFVHLCCHAVAALFGVDGLCSSQVSRAFEQLGGSLGKAGTVEKGGGR